MAKKKTKKTTEVDLSKTTMRVTIEATYDMNEILLSEVENEIENAIDSLRCNGEAKVISRTLTRPGGPNVYYHNQG